MKIWEVVRNAEMNFTDDFRTVYQGTENYKDPNEYSIINTDILEFKMENSEDEWLTEVKYFHQEELDDDESLESGA